MILNPIELSYLNRDEYEVELLDRALERYRCNLLLARTSPLWARIRQRYITRLHQHQALRRATEKQSQAEEEEVLKAALVSYMEEQERAEQAPDGLVYI